MLSIEQMQSEPQDPPPPSRVLATPELLTLVAQYLNRRQLLCGLQVCRGWHRALVPLYWHDVFIADHSPPHASALRKHADFVLTLVVHTEVLRQAPVELQGITLPRLRTLGVYQDQRGINEAHPLVDLIKRHQSSLTKIGIEHVTSQVLMDAIAGCTKLEELQVDYLLLDSPELWMRHYGSFWSHLRELTIRGPWFKGPSKDNQSTSPMLAGMLHAHESQTQFRYLDMLGSSKEMLQIQSSLIEKSPELSQLIWASVHSFEDHRTPLALLARSIQAGRFSQQLEVLSVAGAGFEDEDLRLVLESMQLSKLDFHYTGFRPSSWLVLKNKVPRYMTTLKSLSLAGCPNLTGTVIHNVLCSIVSLELFHADYVKFSNLVEDGRDWVCASLSSLTLAILMDAGRRLEDHHLVFSRLSKLTRLEFLDMNPECHQRTYNRQDVPSRAMLFHGPMPTMERGMAQLASLTRIRFFGVCPEQRVGWTLDETRWAIEHWPYLNELSGVNFHSNPVELCKKASVSLTNCGVLKTP